MSYGGNSTDAVSSARHLHRRVLKGEKPADLPVAVRQSRVGHQLKTAKALGLTVPNTLIGRADEVIEYRQCLILALSGHFSAARMSAFGGKADMPFCTANVRL